jgi:leader peptidase (prepilin peptidase)/N-methyltransferase
MKYRWAGAAMTLFMGLWAYTVAGWPAAGWLTFVAALLVDLAEEDYKTGLLPNQLTMSLLLVGLAFAPWATGMGWTNSLLGALVGGGLALAVIAASAKMTGKAGWGVGDLKLLAALGAWVGWYGVLPVVLFSSVLAVAWIYGYRWYMGKRLKQIPFGPFLALGGWLALLYQQAFWQVIVRASAW